MVQAAATHKVLLLGSGMMTPPLVDYLCKFGDTHVTVASNIIEDAQKIASRHPNHMSAMFLDVFDVSLQLFYQTFPSVFEVNQNVCVVVFASLLLLRQLFGNTLS